MSGIVKVVLTPPRVEFIPNLVRECSNVRTLVLEIPEVESFKQFLEGKATVDDVLSELELDYPLFTRELLQAARRLYRSGVSVVAIDPYQEIAVDVKMRIFLRKGLEKLEQDYTARYIALLELNISKILSEYYRAPRNNFDYLVELTVKYAKFDAERIRFKSELRARKIAELIKTGVLKTPLVVHTFFMNTVLAKMLSEKLGKDYEVVNVDLYREACLKMFNTELTHPGRELTRMFLEGDVRDHEKIKLLAAQSVILVSLYPKSEVLPRSEGEYPLLKKDYDIVVNILSELDTYDKCRNFYLSRLKKA